MSNDKTTLLQKPNSHFDRKLRLTPTPPYPFRYKKENVSNDNHFDHGPNHSHPWK